MKKFKKQNKLISIILGSLLLPLVACYVDHPMPAPVLGDERTVIVYMNANNNLYDLVNGSKHYGALVDINEMESSWSDQFKGTLLVYLNPSATSGLPPKLYKIRHDNNLGQISSPVIKTYNSHDANEPSTLSMVIADAQKLAPSDNYALILWSHGTGWVPKGLGTTFQTTASPAQYTFGSSDSWNKSEMEIDDLARALPNNLIFDYIAFDACYMGGIEVAYELRKKCNYFIGSAVETPVDGFEYDIILKDMMLANVKDMVEKNFNYYNQLTGWWATCAMSVVDCSKLDALAAATKNLVETSPKSLSSINFNTIQDLSSSRSFRGTYYDFGDFINSTWQGASGLAKFNTALHDAVLTKFNTPRNLGNYPINTYSGFSCFAPKANQREALSAFRARFAWSADSGIGSMN